MEPSPRGQPRESTSIYLPARRRTRLESAAVAMGLAMIPAFGGDALSLGGFPDVNGNRCEDGLRRRPPGAATPALQTHEVRIARELLEHHVAVAAGAGFQENHGDLLKT